MAYIPADATAFAVFDMQKLGADSFVAGDGLTVVFF